MSKLFDALNSLEARKSEGQEAIYYCTEKQEDKGRWKRPVWMLPLLVFLFFVAVGLGFILSLSSLKMGHTRGAAGFDPGRQIKTDVAAPAMPTTPAISAVDDKKDKKDIKDNTRSDAGSRAVPDSDMREADYLAQKPVSKRKNIQEKTRSEKNGQGKAREKILNGGHELALPPSHEFVKDESGLTSEHLLQQAEEYRIAGRMEEAVELYRTVWAKTGDARVANNLAAALLVLGRAKEAEGILSEALKKAPDDIDLKFNLDFARRKLTQAVHDR
ncbi:MAG: tetratricopeptide repeat protein [Dissulfurimicrobium sp.]|uniref:tetratricopeptide repeat protein n=1 Tax=Dissulfurimicrobium sp. TaxID=2022436 RepID=UPI00404A1F7B